MVDDHHFTAPTVRILGSSASHALLQATQFTLEPQLLMFSAFADIQSNFPDS